MPLSLVRAIKSLYMSQLEVDLQKLGPLLKESRTPWLSVTKSMTDLGSARWHDIKRTKSSPLGTV